jgi:hypothetical protein
LPFTSKFDRRTKSSREYAQEETRIKVSEHKAMLGGVRFMVAPVQDTNLQPREEEYRNKWSA